MRETCPACNRPVGISPTAPQSPRCECDPWERADAFVAKAQERQADELRDQVEAVTGYTLRGFLNGQWSARTPKDRVLTGATPAELVRKVRADAGLDEATPRQEGFGW